MMYPKFTNNSYFNIYGGLMFLIARIFIIIGLITYPYRKLRRNYKMFITLDFKKIMVFFVPSLLFSVGVGAFFATIIKSKIKGIMVFIYFLIIGLHLFLSFYRLGEFKIESITFQVLAIIGTLLFTISDTMLILYMYLYKFPYGDILSISFYWISMCFLSSSVIRNKNDIVEKNGGSEF